MGLFRLFGKEKNKGKEVKSRKKTKPESKPKKISKIKAKSKIKPKIKLKKAVLKNNVKKIPVKKKVTKNKQVNKKIVKKKTLKKPIKAKKQVIKKKVVKRKVLNKKNVKTKNKKIVKKSQQKKSPLKNRGKNKFSKIPESKGVKKIKDAKKAKDARNNKGIKEIASLVKDKVKGNSKILKDSVEPKEEVKTKKEINTEENKSVKKLPTLSRKKSNKPFSMAAIKKQIEQQLKKGKIDDSEAEVLEQRAPAEHVAGKVTSKKLKLESNGYLKTGVPGFDELFERGIPKGNAIIMAGGAGSGKTIFCLQTLMNHVAKGKKCFYMSFEESESRLIKHMEDFGWDPKKYIKKGTLKIKRYSPFEISRSVEAMLAKEKGELMIDIDPVILPKGFKPDILALDSLTAIASAFTGKEDSYRIYIEQLFRFFEKLETTAFLITETKQIPEIFSTTGVEEFLADGVIVLYNFKRGDVRENAIEVLKMRGEHHQKKIVAMQITEDGIIVYPEQEIFGGINGS